MDRRILASIAAALLAASAAPAAALDNGVTSDTRCQCFCDTGITASYDTYDSRGYGCGALEGRTCNIENPQTGLIQTGRLLYCSPRSSHPNLTDRITVSPGSSGGSVLQVRPGLSGPLSGILRQ